MSIEKKELSDYNEHLDQESVINNRLSGLAEKADALIQWRENDIHREVVAELESNERKREKTILDIGKKSLDINNNVKTPVVLQKKQNSILQSLAEISPGSSQESQAGRKNSYHSVIKAIATLPFGLDKFFANA